MYSEEWSGVSLLAGNPIAMLFVPFAAVFGILLCASVARRRADRKSDRGVVFLAGIFFWQIFLILRAVFQDSSDLLNNLFYVPLTLLAVTFLFYAIGFYRVRCLDSPRIFFALFAVPAAWAVFIPLSGFGHRADLISIYYTLICAFTLAVVITMICRLPAAYRRGSVFHLIYLISVIFTEILVFALRNRFDTLFDIQGISISIAGLMFYFALLINSDSSDLSVDQSSLIDFLDSAIFILNEDGVIVECNRTAVVWLRSLGRKVENISFDGLMSLLSNNKFIAINKAEGIGEDHVRVLGTAVPLIYKMSRRSLIMSDGVTKGGYITLTDISRNQLLVERLRDMAGVDALTQTANRYRYQDLLRKLDQKEYYPLAVIIGDVNGLKTINDSFGHSVGDEYLKVIASVLVDCCPAGGYVARYGGDEFVTLIPNSSQEIAERYIADVGNSMKEPIRSNIRPSIALGCTIKHHGNENLNELIARADQEMYAAKMARKAAEREALSHV